MIPYFQQPQITIGSIHITSFGILIAIGMQVAAWFGQREARRQGFDSDKVLGAIIIGLFFGFIFAHLFTIFFYNPEKLAQNGWRAFFDLSDGLSSFGGFIGAIIGGLIYHKGFKNIPVKLADIYMQTGLIGMTFGRLGCALAFDHPGYPTHFFLGFVREDGIARHNLGFYEFLFLAFVMVPTVLWLHKKNPKPGTYIAAICLMYAPIRFLLDFMRIHEGVDSDRRYAGLTPAQWLCFVVLYVGILFANRARKSSQNE